jgi:hypothetical protein
VQLIRYEGWPVALAGADEVHLHPALLELAELEAVHALVHFACTLALHAFEVATGLEQGRSSRDVGSGSLARCSCRARRSWPWSARAMPRWPGVTWLGNCWSTEQRAATIASTAIALNV